MFISTFRKATESCGFSPVENTVRLQKSLKRETRKAVNALLMTTKVDKLIGILQNRFGRPEYIIQGTMQKAIEYSRIKEA